jgi:hypothetical protein
MLHSAGGFCAAPSEHNNMLHSAGDFFRTESEYYELGDSYYNRRKAQATQPHQREEPQEQPRAPPRQPHPWPAAAAAGPSRPPPPPQQQQQAQWQTQQPKQKPKKAPQPQQSAPVGPVEVVEAKDGVAAFAKEMDERRKALQMQREQEDAYKAQPVGRCCLNRGLAGEARWCHKDKWQALVRSPGACW